jgi:hypothetical protein
MANKVIKVTIDEATGEFNVDLTGFEGQGCDDVIKAFAEIGEVTKELHKPEYNRPIKTTLTRGK